MDEIQKRFASLTPEQRALLELRLRRQGLRSPLDEANAKTGVEVAQHAAPVDASRDEDEDPQEWRSRPVERRMGFGLYFFSDDGSKDSADKYRLVVESAKFADREGFDAVWTPERHFQPFGGLYPNPSVLCAALASITERVGLRAGSVALPLHHPVRVAEEWSMVDNLSHGRVGVSFASGWHPDDFIFAPDAYDERKEVMFRHIELIQKLWSGETVSMQGTRGRETQVRVLPRPLQPRLPVWITSAGSPETWTRAGSIGANILAALIGYSFEDLQERIRSYREARAASGHDPASGIVTMMLHTFVGESTEDVKRKVRAPFTNYLRSYFKQYDNVRYDADEVTEADRDAIMSAAFDHYFDTNTLMGTPSKCARVIDRMLAAGVDEAACLVDFGVETEDVLESLRHLNELREHYDKKQAGERGKGKGEGETASE
ncbi:MAG TPA: LLM class flavin-dependent oxidoreductase [Pyrinomonadaceae bacterium]|jgi:natural product biosynthesis luciferase-like monooxygenase protein